MADPLALLSAWLPGEPGVDGYVPEMSLATVGLDGFPDVRTVLLSRLSDAELFFHTDSRSRKVAQLAAVPRAAVSITLAADRRQIVVQGEVSPTDPDDLAEAYRRRSPYLRQLAWVNSPEIADLGSEERAQLWADFATTHPDDSLTPPPTWCGFRLRPVRVTFWQGVPDAPSHRVEYRYDGPRWWVVDLPG